MANRGRGRGRGRGNYTPYIYTIPVPFVPYPIDEVDLPPLPSLSKKNEFLFPAKDMFRFAVSFKDSCYHLVPQTSKPGKQDKEIERYSDRSKDEKKKREDFYSYLKLTPSNFPLELVEGTNKPRHHKKLRWDRNTEHKLDWYEKLENTLKPKDDDEKEGEESEKDSEDEEKIEEESDEGDYEQNIDFDDDEDDMNMAEQEFEDVYED